MALSADINWCVRTDGSDSICGGGSRSGAILSRPSAPAVAGSGAGGTIAAGTYYVVVVYRDMYGESQYSPETSVVLTGVTSSFTITGPTRPTGGYTWDAYAGTVSGGPYFQLSTGLTFGTNFTRTTTPPTTGTQPPGANYTNQAAAQINYTDLVIDGTTNTKATSALNPFTTDSVGQILRVTSGTGFTVQFVECIGVAVGVATFDKSLGTLSSTGGNAYMGGAFATPGFVGGTTGGARLVAQNWVHIKSGTYSITTSTGNASGGPINFQSVSFWEGFGTNRGDFGTPPVIQSNTNTITILGSSGGTTTDSSLFRNITIDGNSKTANKAALMGANYMIFDRVKFMNCTNGGLDVFTAVANSIITRCEFTNISGGNSLLIGAVSIVDDCYFHDQAVSGITVPASAAGISIRNCIFDTLTGGGTRGITGISQAADAGSIEIQNCSFYNIGQYGISMAASAGPRFPWCRIENNIFEACTSSPVNVPGQNTFITTNAYYNNGAITYGARYEMNDITLTGSPFTNAAAGDFSLNNTANAGALCRGAAILGIFPGGLSTGYLSIGAVQEKGQQVTGYSFAGAA